MNHKFTSKSIFFPLIIIFVFVFNMAGTLPQVPNNYDFGNLKNKSYYTILFNQTEQVELAKADEEYLKGKTEFLKSEQEFKKADGYRKISQKYGGQKDGKAVRSEKKAVKRALKAYDYFFKASDSKFHVYSERLKKMENDNSKKHLKAEEIGIEARALYMVGSDMKLLANSLSGKAKVSQLEAAFKTHLKAINQQEIAFGIFMDDPDINPDEISDVVTDEFDNNEINNQTENKYNPNLDPNLYISIEESIVAKLNMSHTDKSLLDDSKDKRAYAESIMHETDNEYNKIEDIRYQADKIEDQTEKELKLKMAAGLEKVLFEKMIKAANLFFDADKIKYGIYAKYLPVARNSKTINEGRKFEDNSVLLHADAQKIYNKANFYSDHQSNLYIQIMNAVQTELSAIQEQENAFATYLVLKTTPLEEEIIVDNNKHGETDDNSYEPKLTYNYKGSYMYSKYNPEPVALVHKDGIIFKVQIGLFKELLPLKKYGKYSPISYDTYKNNPYKRFMLGEFRSYKAAEYVLNNVITKGLTDPFIVSYVNGERKTATYGMSNIQRDEEFEKIEALEMSYLTGVNDDPNEVITENNQIENKIESKFSTTKINTINEFKSLAYFVQIGNFSEQKSMNDFKGAGPIFVEKTTNGYKYLTGTFQSYEKAKEKSTDLNQSAFSGTFVTAYYDGEKITLNKAKTLSESNPKQIQTSATNLYFTVQIGAYSNELNNEELKQFDEINNKHKISKTKVDGGLYLYTIGKFNEYSEAAEFKKEIKYLNIDGFVIAFKNGNRISAQDAIEFLKQNK